MREPVLSVVVLNTKSVIISSNVGPYASILAPILVLCLAACAKSLMQALRHFNTVQINLIIQRSRARTCALAMSGDRHHDIAILDRGHRSSASLSQSCSDAVQFCSSDLSKMRSPTPYTGSAGLAYALWRAGCLLHNHGWQQQAQELAASALRRGAHLEDASLLDGESANLTSHNRPFSGHGRDCARASHSDCDWTLEDACSEDCPFPQSRG